MLGKLVMSVNMKWGQESLGLKLKRVISEKDLGVIIDEKLKFPEHTV